MIKDQLRNPKTKEGRVNEMKKPVEKIIRFRCPVKRCGGHTYRYMETKGICYCVLCGNVSENALKKAKRS
jgi:hypothetical protein